MRKIHLGDYIKVINKVGVRAGVVKDIYKLGNFNVVRLSGIVDFLNKKYLKDNSINEYDINSCELLSDDEICKLNEIYKENNRKVVFNNVECIDYMLDFSEDIKGFLKEEYPNVDIESMDLEQLKRFKDEVESKRQEYFLLEIAQKQLGNAAYGAAASPYFYFFSVDLAADITSECRNLTKTMWAKNEEWFHEEIWKRKDLWKQFDFALDESKHDWYRKQHVSIYSDTDSISSNSTIKYEKNGSKENTIETVFNNELNENGIHDVTKNGQEIVKCKDLKVLNWSENKGLNYVPVNYIMRHKVSKPKYKIKSKSGKEIIVTGDHSCIVFRNGKKLVVKAKDINPKTDKILTIKNV